ncbi:hypothetical protein IT418_04005 [bacterium]|nr:hypothetical protein [bacterium]
MDFNSIPGENLVSPKRPEINGTPTDAEFHAFMVAQADDKTTQPPLFETPSPKTPLKVNYRETPKGKKPSNVTLALKGVLPYTSLTPAEKVKFKIRGGIPQRD